MGAFLYGVDKVRSDLHFVYNGIHSRDMGVVQVATDEGLLHDRFLATKTIIEERIRGRDKPYLMGVEYESFRFPLRLYFQNGFDSEVLGEVSRWFEVDYFKPFYFEGNPEKIYFCMIDGETNLIHNGNGEGYIELEMVCDSPYAYTPIYTSNIYEVDGEQEIEFLNYGDMVCKPVLTLEMVGDGAVSIINLSNAGKGFTIANLVQGEVLEIDCEQEQIESNYSHRYDDFEGEFLELVTGVNRLKVQGNCKLQFKYRFRLL